MTTVRHEPGTSLISDIDRGWYVYEARLPGGDYEVDHQRSGVVIDVEDVADRETGEVVRTFHVAREWQGRVVRATLREDQVDEVEIHLPNSVTIRSLIGRMNAVLARHRGAYTEFEVWLSESQSKLARAIG